MDTLPDTENATRSASPHMGRRGRSPEKFVVSRDVFKAEIYEYVDNIGKMYAGCHGDHVIAMALVNPLARTASPRVVMAVLVDAALPAGGLWARFKAEGGVSKELGDVDESEQLEAIRGVWASLQGASQTPSAFTPATE